ncbi:PAS domain S-box protein [Paenibacillus tuaregi]|uniref:PAS domain S-box protein n=1 Tax=Paenibacillus tuaregi TaxID=1816681 RepID=UPI00083816BB|nr:PAS domain S-box protein [Paenibacillus tuaregi]
MTNSKSELLHRLISEGGAYRSLYENHPDAISVMDTTGKYIHANSAAERVTGYELEQFVRIPSDHLFTAEGERLRQYYFKRALSGESYGFEIKFKCGDGRLLDLYVTYVPIQLSHEIIGVYSVFKDITATKEIEQRLLESEKLYQVITNDAKDVIAFTSEEGICISISPAIQELVGYTPEQLVGTSLKELFADQNSRYKYELNKTSGIVTGRLKHAQGHEIWVEASIQKVRNTGDSTDKLLIIARDITARMIAEEQLRISEQSLARAQRIAHIGSWQWEAAQDELICSQEFVSIYGVDFSNAENPMEEWLKAVHPEDSMRIRNFIQSANLLGRRSFELEFRITGADNKEKVLFSQTDIEVDASGEVSRLFGIVQDITERYQMERRLRDSEKQYRLISENSLDFISRHKSDEGNTYSYASPACMTLLGYTPEELVGTSAFDYFHPNDYELVKEYLSEQLSARDKYTVTYRIRRKDGVYIWFESTGKYTYDEQTGERLDVIAVSRDVTERKNSERRLQESQQRYKSLFEHSPSAVYSFDLAGRYKTVNANLEALSGYSKDELVGKSFKKLIHGPELNKTLYHFGLSMKGQPQTYETTLIHKNGTPVELSVTNVPIIVDDQVVGVYGIASDITERKRYIEQIEQLSYQHALILNSVSEGIYGLDEEGRTIFMNPAASKMLGYTVKEVIGTINHELIHHTRSDGISYPIEECPIHQTLRDGTPRYVNEEVFWRKDGSSFLVTYRVTPLYDREQIVGTVVVFNDITNEREIIKAKESAERATKAKSEFLAMMSHEIRTPLNGIIGMSDLLLETELEEEQKEYAHIISDSGRALLRILNDVLDFSKVEAGKMALEYDSFNLRASVASVVDLFAPGAAEKGLAITYSIDPSIPEMIISDPSRVRQVLINLVGNALKFTESGKITIHVSRIPASEFTGLLLEFSISDTGIGIPRDKLNRLFQSFSQLHPGINRKYGGTGLGLAICKKIVELMGGSISVESTEGNGSTFRFTVISYDANLIQEDSDFSGTLIREDQGEEGSESLSIQPLQTERHLKVLIAEDHPVNRQVFVQMLGKLGIAPDIARNGVEAVEAVSRQRYDLIFMDINMSVMDGIKAARIIRQLVPEGEKPVIIAVSAYDYNEDRKLCLESGMEDFMKKPLTPEKIQRKLQEWKSVLDLRYP